MKACILLIEEPLPRDALKFAGLKSYQVPVVWDADSKEKLKQMFPRAIELEDWLKDHSGEVLLRTFLAGVSNPVAQTLAGVLELDESKVRVDGWIVSKDNIPASLVESLKFCRGKKILNC